MADKTKDKTKATGKTTVFLHPDLGIGGAERLVVDAAVGLQNRGHKVVIFTSHCDPSHCFDEARDGTLDVRVRGNTIVPSSILSRFSILCAILRQLHLILQIYFSSELAELSPDLFFIDQLSAGLPLLQYLYPRGRIFFYCHFPDLLLVQGRQKWWRRAYRVPFDWLEQWSMSFADAIAVNSNFTKGVVSRTWPSLAGKRDLKTVYPCVDTNTKKSPGVENGTPLWKGKKFLLSINRFERKKDVALAIKAYAGLSSEARKGVRLVVAGGYDNRVPENVGYHNELVQLANSLGLNNVTANTLVTALEVPDEVQVLFLLSVPNLLKETLLSSTQLLVYTPANEHFGIVPLEAMLAGVPVLAADTGGPTETVVEGETGWLRSPTKVESWTEVMDKVLNKLSKEELTRMSQVGVSRVKNNFGDVQMAERIDGICDDILKTKTKPGSYTPILLALGVVGGLLGAALAIALVAMGCLADLPNELIRKVLHDALIQARIPPAIPTAFQVSMEKLLLDPTTRISCIVTRNRTIRCALPADSSGPSPGRSGAKSTRAVYQQKGSRIEETLRSTPQLDLMVKADGAIVATWLYIPEAMYGQCWAINSWIYIPLRFFWSRMCGGPEPHKVDGEISRLDFRGISKGNKGGLLSRPYMSTRFTGPPRTYDRRGSGAWDDFSHDLHELISDIAVDLVPQPLPPLLPGGGGRAPRKRLATFIDTVSITTPMPTEPGLHLAARTHIPLNASARVALHPYLIVERLWSDLLEAPSIYPEPRRLEFGLGDRLL
ncbi:putative Family 1 glycosyltransferase [Seiridium unicorne]|uniref:Alpha-1,3/1,6-mannosyltransferase ALG2 n=1 Tax=Seiridium unicorne TaxID=138068 RepID=A0ABR2VIX1_9PEZI